MKVTKIDVTVNRRKPNPKPIRDALQSLPGSGSVRVVIQTDEEISGSGEAGFGRIAGAPDALAAIVEHELKPLILGTDPGMVRGTHEAMLRETEYHGSFGLTMFGIAAIDTALWDCLGKARGVPCWQLWGAVHKLIPAYASARNPIDMTPIWPKFAELYPKCIRALYESDDVDIVVPILLQRAALMPEVCQAVAETVNECLAEGYKKPTYVCWVATKNSLDNMDILQKARVPCYDWPERTARAIGSIASYTRFLESRGVTPGGDR